MYYHILIETDKTEIKSYDILDKDYIIKRIVSPYIDGVRFQLDGYIIKPHDITRLLITETEKSVKYYQDLEIQSLASQFMFWPVTAEEIAFKNYKYSKDVSLEFIDILKNRKEIQPMKPSIFLSHSWEDKFFVRKLAKSLKDAGVDVWIDEAEIKVGDSLIQKISEGISKTNYLAAILSHNSVNSPWVQKELDIAMNEEINGKKLHVLPILMEQCDIPKFLQGKLYADFTSPEKFEESFNLVLRSVGIENIHNFLGEVSVTNHEQLYNNLKPNDNLEEFVDIKIVGVDKDKVYNPDPSKLLYNVYFTLSSRPSNEWVQIFDAERKFPRHSMWRKAWVEDQHIVVHCCIEEVKKYHLNDLKRDVENTNNTYRNYLYEEKIKQESSHNRQHIERKNIFEALDGLDF